MSTIASTAVRPTGRRLRGASRLLVAVAAFAALAAPTLVLAQAQGPTTSGGNLPYIASGQSEEQVLKRKRARAEAEQKARQDAARAEADEKARQDSARATAEPPPAAQKEQPGQGVAAKDPVAKDALAKETGAKETGAKESGARVPAGRDVAERPREPARPEAARTGRPAELAATPQQPSVKIIRPRPPADLPPGLAPGVVADARVPAARPQPLAQPQSGIVIVRRPLFFGLFGPQVDVTERAVDLLPPGSIGAPPPARPAPKVANGQRRPADNCHYHAYQVMGMTAHRDIQCHWHPDPGDPSLRYVH